MFSELGLKVKLSEMLSNGKRVHSLIRWFKKYGTQSVIRLFKYRSVKKWQFTIEINRFMKMKSEGTFPDLEDGASWSIHDIGGHLDDITKTKRMMNRNGGTKFLVKHSSTANIAGRVFTSNVREAAERALSNGCDKGELVERLECLKALALDMTPGDVKLPEGGGVSSYEQGDFVV